MYYYLSIRRLFIKERGRERAMHYYYLHLGGQITSMCTTTIYERDHPNKGGHTSTTIMHPPA